jgi:hypothetical protein
MTLNLLNLAMILLHMNSDVAIIIGLMIGLGIGFGVAYFLFQMKQQDKKLIIMRNAQGQIEGLVQS